MSLEKRLPGHSYHTLSGQWKTMGKLFSSMAVPLTINRVTTALFNSLENLLIPQKLQAFGYSCLLYTSHGAFKEILLCKLFFCQIMMLAAFLGAIGFRIDKAVILT